MQFGPRTEVTRCDKTIAQRATARSSPGMGCNHSGVAPALLRRGKCILHCRIAAPLPSRPPWLGCLSCEREPDSPVCEVGEALGPSAKALHCRVTGARAGTSAFASQPRKTLGRKKARVILAQLIFSESFRFPRKKNPKCVRVFPTGISLANLAVCALPARGRGPKIEEVLMRPLRGNL